MFRADKEFITALEAILNSGNIAECKIESGNTPVIIEIKRSKKFPSRKINKV